MRGSRHHVTRQGRWEPGSFRTFQTSVRSETKSGLGLTVHGGPRPAGTSRSAALQGMLNSMGVNPGTPGSGLAAEAVEPGRPSKHCSGACWKLGPPAIPSGAGRIAASQIRRHSPWRFEERWQAAAQTRRQPAKQPQGTRAGTEWGRRPLRSPAPQSLAAIRRAKPG